MVFRGIKRKTVTVTVYGFSAVGDGPRDLGAYEGRISALPGGSEAGRIVNLELEGKGLWLSDAVDFM